MTDVAATAVLASLLVGLAIATWNAVRLRAPLILNAAHGLLGEIIGGLAAGMLMVVYLFFAVEDWRHHPVEIPIYIAGISGGATGTLCGLYLSERRSARAPLIAWVGALGAYGAPVLAAWAIWLLGGGNYWRGSHWLDAVCAVAVYSAPFTAPLAAAAGYQLTAARRASRRL